MSPFIIKEEMDVMDSGNDYDDELMSTELLEEICGSSQSHLSVSRREARYKIGDCIKQRAIGMEMSVIIYAKHG